MKLIKLSILIIFIPFTIFPQRESSVESTDSIFVPLSVGNIWQYMRETYDVYGVSFDLSCNSIEADSTIGKFHYYKMTENSDLIRYSKNEKKLYIRWNDSDHVYIDFNKPNGASYQSFYGGGYRTVFAKAGEHYIFNLYRVYGGYSIGFQDYQIWYTDSIGMSYDRSQYNYYDFTGRGLIQAIIYDSLDNQIHFTYHHKPVFEITPITIINSSNFVLPFKIQHYYTRSLIPNQPPWHSGVDFIDSVKMFSYYSKDDSVIFNQPIIPFHSLDPVNTDYIISIQIDTTLLKNGFVFNYRFFAEDKGIIPESTSSPDSGYYVCLWDETNGIKINTINLLAKFSLDQNYPNPFNPSTKIKFTIPTTPQSPPYQGGEAKQGWFVQLKVYDVLGNEIAMLVNEEKPAGTYEVEFNPTSGIRNPASGIYFYQLKAGDYIDTKKMILLK